MKRETRERRQADFFKAEPARRGQPGDFVVSDKDARQNPLSNSNKVLAVDDIGPSGEDTFGSEPEVPESPEVSAPLREAPLAVRI
ncbi:hypothetical protein WJX73_008196 [Symbiochloris irregularis]|uniref:Uncharacterized protein n=1 Tax=Symbiochloris irregularis TaxID=706552 RepID=A0AAW1PJ07_9CHLO